MRQWARFIEIIIQQYNETVERERERWIEICGEREVGEKKQGIG